MTDQPTRGMPLAVAELRYAIKKEPLSLTLTLSDPARAAMKKALEALPKPGEPEPAPLLLGVEEIQFEMEASGTVELYLNLTKPAPDKDTDKACAVGTFAHFSGHTHAPAGGGLTPPAYPKEVDEHNEETRFSRIFDVTDNLQRLHKAGHLKEGELRITLLRRPLDKKAGALEGQVSFARVTLDLGAMQ